LGQIREIGLKSDENAEQIDVIAISNVAQICQCSVMLILWDKLEPLKNH